MSQITISIIEAERIAKSLITAKEYADAIHLLISLDEALDEDKNGLATNKIKSIKATPTFKKKRNAHTWTPERRAAASALTTARNEAKRLARARATAIHDLPLSAA